jgi:mannose/fructose-specific phosphotransferase system component IIA
LTYFARSKTASDDEVQVLTDLAGGAAESAVAAGCDDPIDQCG